MSKNNNSSLTDKQLKAVLKKLNPLNKSTLESYLKMYETYFETVSATKNTQDIIGDTAQKISGPVGECAKCRFSSKCPLTYTSILPTKEFRFCPKQKSLPMPPKKHFPFLYLSEQRNSEIRTVYCN